VPEPPLDRVRVDTKTPLRKRVAFADDTPAGAVIIALTVIAPPAIGRVVGLRVAEICADESAGSKLEPVAVTVDESAALSIALIEAVKVSFDPETLAGAVNEPV
jgi:hypothetical protein